MHHISSRLPPVKTPAPTEIAIDVKKATKEEEPAIPVVPLPALTYGYVTVNFDESLTSTIPPVFETKFLGLLKRTFMDSPTPPSMPGST